MKKVIFNICIFASFMLISCDGIFDSDECVEEFVGITNISIPDDISINEEFEIKISYIFTNGCLRLKRVEEEKTNSKIYIGLIQCKRMPEWNCNHEVRYDTLRKSFTLNKSGNFTITINDSSFTRKVRS